MPGRAPGCAPGSRAVSAPTGVVRRHGGTWTTVPAAPAEIDPDSVPGQLGALRDRFGLDDDHVNTVDEEKQRTSFWTLVELVTDLQRSWDLRRLDFTLGAGNGFLGTRSSCRSACCSRRPPEQVNEFEAGAGLGARLRGRAPDRRARPNSGLTLDDLVQWLRVFFTEDGPNIIRDTGRDGLVSSFTPTAAALLLTLREKLVRGRSCRAPARGAPAAAIAALAAWSRASRSAAAPSCRPACTRDGSRSRYRRSAGWPGAVDAQGDPDRPVRGRGAARSGGCAVQERFGLRPGGSPRPAPAADVRPRVHRQAW